MNHPLSVRAPRAAFPGPLAVVAVTAAVAIAAAAAAQSPPPEPPPDPLPAAVAAHAAWCHELYGECAKRARALQRAVDELVATPSAATLGAARAAWLHARVVYGRSEVLRFQDGPIEPLEPFLNAWPIDEAFLDYVAGAPATGLVQDVAGYPNLSAAVLRLANERGGEANVSTGWHAIEFLLWGQDLAADGPGARPVRDFVPGEGPDAARRGACLRTLCTVLVDDLTALHHAWAPTAKHRAAFVAAPTEAVRCMLAGALVLTSFELAGERLTVALETRDQEQEHSCFSDSTCADLIANQQGITEVLRGAKPGGGLLVVLRARDARLAAHLDAALTTTERALAAIPAPFDQAFLGADDSAGRVAIRAAIAALEAQAEALLLAGRVFGHDLPLAPGG